MQYIYSKSSSLHGEQFFKLFVEKTMLKFLHFYTSPGQVFYGTYP